MRVTGYVARLAVVATVLVAAPASTHAQHDPWDSPPPAGEHAAPPAPAPAAPAAPSPIDRSPDDPAAAARIEVARRDVFDDEYQRELPGAVAAASGGRAAALPGRQAGGLGGREQPARADVRHRDEPRTVSSMMYLVMWGLVIAVAVLGAAWLFTELSRFGGDARLPPDPEHARRAAREIIERPLEDADELAGRGQFAEAIHTLLLRTLRELARSASVQVAAADTSREILARVPLVAGARSALAGLVSAVEITHFGDEPASAEDYDSCRRQFHVFAEAFRGPAGAAQAAA